MPEKDPTYMKKLIEAINNPAINQTVLKPRAVGQTTDIYKLHLNKEERCTRRTGRTFRSLLEGLKSASEGKNIIYVCASDRMAIWTFDKATRIVRDFMEPNIPEKLLLKIGDGSVRFTGKIRDELHRAIEKNRKVQLIQD